MSKPLAIYTTPLDASVELRHDSGPTFSAVAGEAHGRPAHLFVIDGVPDGWGANLIVAWEGIVPVKQRGILYLHRDGAYAEFVVDDVTLAPVVPPL